MLLIAGCLPVIHIPYFNGPGIPQDILNTVFEPFVTSGKKDGTGLGPAIVKQYVLAHGATIEAKNDNGAVFSIRGMRRVGE